jgi:MscS family membrane protein
MLAIIVGGSWYAVSTLNFGEGINNFVNSAFTFALVLVGAWMITRLFDALFKEYIEPLAEKSETDFDDQILPVIKKGVKVAIWVLAIILGLDNAGYDVGAVLAGLGIGGLALALAAQDAVANLFGGITIFADKPFKLKDRIKVNGYDGFVQEIGLRSTRIKTLAGTEVIIPNKIFANNEIENIQREPAKKITVNLGLTYDTKPKEMEKALKILEKIHDKNLDLLTKDKYIAFMGFGDFSLNITFIYYMKRSAGYFEPQNKINLEILEEFNKAGLNFAFPTQTIELLKK